MAQGGGVDLAVGGARHEARGPVLPALGEMDHQVLPVPHGRDHRLERADALVGVRRIEDEPVGPPHEAEVAGGEIADRFPKGFPPRDPLQHPHGTAFKAADRAGGADAR
jgi:hypothetical protein